MGFRPDILFRTIAEIQEVVGRNPLAKRRGIEPNKLADVFLESEPPAAARQALLAMDIALEEIEVVGRQLFVYFPERPGTAEDLLAARREDTRQDSHRSQLEYGY